MLSSDRNKLVEHIITQYSQLAKEYNYNNCLGKVFHWELCKILKFDSTDKWYMKKKQNLSKKIGPMKFSGEKKN